MTVTKITKGLYEISYTGRTFQVEDIRQASDGELAAGWMLYEIVRGNREYINDFGTKRSAIKAIS